MLGFLLKLSLLISVLFALAIGVIRAQPYDDGGLRDFLFNSPGCETIPDDEPCFMGISPDVTTLEQALVILESHPWVDEAYLIPDWWVGWEFNGLQPDFISSVANGQYGRISYDNDRDRTFLVEIHSEIPAGDFYSLLGRPDFAQVVSGKSGFGIFVSTGYNQHSLFAHLNLLCPLTFNDYWKAPLVIEFGAPYWEATEFETWEEMLSLSDC